MAKLINTIDTYKLRIDALEAIRKVAKTFDGKVLNKRFVDALETIPDVLASLKTQSSIEKYHKLEVWMKSLDYEHSTVIYVHSCEDKFLEGNRIDFQRFNRLIDESQQRYKGIISNIQEDIRTGEQRLKQWNELAAKMDELTQSFSTEFRDLYRYSFNRVSKP